MAKLLKNLEGKIENVDLGPLLTDPSYQRPIKRHHKLIAADFNPAAAGVLCVGHRNNGKHYLIDGQQRREAMLAIGIKRWKAQVIHSDGPKFEAQIFKLLNGRDTRKALHPIELFAACITAEDPTALATQRAVEGAGLRLKPTHGGTRGWPELVCHGALYRETAKYGEALVARALTDMAKAWPGQDECMKDMLPVSLIKLYGRLGEQIDSARMVERLASVPPRKVLLDAMVATTNRFTRCQEVLAEVYNRRLPAARRLRLVKAEEAA